MALRFSTGLRDAIAVDYGWASALGNGRLRIYSGVQPATADAAPTGTLLLTFTKAGGTYTAETINPAIVRITGGTAGTIVVKAGGLPLNDAVSWTTSHANTATLLAAAINAKPGQQVRAAVNGSDATQVDIYAPKCSGNSWNSVAITTTLTGDVTDTHDSMFSGCVTAVNGLNWTIPSTAGVLTKESTIWQGTAVATGTAGWFRFEADGADDQTLSTVFKRFDGSIGTSGADLNISNLSIVTSAVQSINNWSITIPSA